MSNGKEVRRRDFVYSIVGDNEKSWCHNVYSSSQREHQQFYHTPSEIRRICVHEHIGCALQDSKVQHFRSHCLFTWHRWNIIVSFLKKNKNITLLTLEKLCDIIKCTPNDIVRFTKRLMGLSVPADVLLFGTPDETDQQGRDAEIQRLLSRLSRLPSGKFQVVKDIMFVLHSIWFVLGSKGSEIIIIHIIPS